jgi:hypothetical protein
MCKSSKPRRDNSAQIAAQKEAERQARIMQGVSNIDSAFAGFNDDFYQGYQDDYLGYYTPQIEDQYNDAVKRLTLRLAQTGNLTGSVGADQLGDLLKYYNTQKTSLTNRALDATNTLRGDIDSRKSQLYADNRAAADPGSAAGAAAEAVQYLQPAPPSSPLANVFGDFFSNLGNAAVLDNARRYRQGTGVQSFGNTTGGGNVDIRGD